MDLCMDLKSADEDAAGAKPQQDFNKAKNMAKKSRVAVSAEVYGKHNQRDEFTPTIIKKSQ
jgi:hypothetical protein